eukprot:1176971-Prorocentrum_minimum.AAC.2
MYAWAFTSALRRSWTARGGPVPPSPSQGTPAWRYPGTYAAVPITRSWILDVLRLQKNCQIKSTLRC